MASLEAEDYVLVDKGEAQGLEQGAGLHDVSHRPASSMAPSTPESTRAPARPTPNKEVWCMTSLHALGDKEPHNNEANTMLGGTQG